MLRKFINSCHRYFAKSTRLVKIFILIRNQCYLAIGYHLGDSCDFNKNGESAMIDFLAQQCYTVLDVGANKGLWSEYFLNKNKNARIIAFEPSNNAFDILQAKFKTVSNIVLIKKGVSNQVKQSSFYEEPDCGETSSLIGFLSNSNAKKTQIELTTIDVVAKEFNLNTIDYLKIDVEGMDFFVLQGAEENLQTQTIKFIQFEYNSSWAYAGSTLIKALTLLTEHNYKTYLLKRDGLYEFSYALYGEYYRYSNFFALPEKCIDIIYPLLKGAV